MNKKRVFISSTMKDLKEEREAVASAIDRFSSLESVLAESIPARDETPREVCLGLVSGCDIYVGIFKNRYGNVPKENNPEENSVVVMEYREAMRSEIPVLVFVNSDSKDREEKLKLFLEEVTDFYQGHWIKEYSDITDLTGKVVDAIVAVISGGFTDNRENKIRRVYDLPFFIELQRKLNEIH